MIPGIVASIPGSAGGWTPLDLPSLWAWFDPSDSDNMVISSGKIEQLNDLSGNARHATQANPSFQFAPSIISGRQWAVAPAGRPYMTFAEALSTDGPVALHAAADAPGGSSVLLGPTATTAGTLGYNQSTSQLIWELSATRVVIQNADFSLPHLIGGEHDGTTARLFLNGTQIGSTTAGSPPSGLSYGEIGYASPSVYDFSGNFGDIVICDDVLSTDDRAALIAYLTVKWGI